MRVLDIHQIQTILTNCKISKRLQQRLRVGVINDMEASAWANHELVGIPTRDKTAGVLLIELQGSIYATAYEIKAVSNKATGRVKPVICDFCKTWQAGGRAGSITFRTKSRALHSISLLCCLDLECSLHVRTMTEAAKLSRVQLREDVTEEYRIERLEDRLNALVDRLELEPVGLSVI